MLQGILGRKLGMTQIFDEAGKWVGVTVIEAGPCPVTQVKSQKTDGYNAVQLGFGKRKRVTKPVAGHLAKSGTKEPIHYIREFRLGVEPTQKQGDSVTLKILDGIKKVDVIGITKGKGWQGVIKLYHKNCSPKTHGSMQQRLVGSRSSAEDPGHVRPGTMSMGRMGGDRFTQKNLMIVKVDEPRNLLLVRGAIPGPNGNFVIIQKSQNQHVPVTVNLEKKDAKASKDPKKALAKVAGK